MDQECLSLKECIAKLYNMPIPTEDLISLSVTNFSTNIGVLPNQVINSSDSNSIDISGILNSGDLRYYPLSSNPSGYQSLQSGIPSGYIQFNNGNTTASWISPISPNWCILREDFIGGTNSDGQRGELGWRGFSIGGTATFTYVSPTDDYHQGILSLTSSATSNIGGSIALGGAGVAPLRNFNLCGWESYFVFKLMTTGIPIKLRIGFSKDVAAGGSVETNQGTWLRYDSESPYFDTGYYFVSRFGGGNEQYPVGIKPDTDWHTLRMWSPDNTYINFQFDTLSGSILNRNDSASKFPVINLMGGGGSTSPVVHVDYFGFMGYCGR